MNREVLVYQEYEEELLSPEKKIYENVNDKLSFKNNNNVFDLEDDFKKYVEKFKDELRNETKKEPYIILLNVILDKKLKEISKAFDKDKKEILNKMITETLNRSSKNVLTNIFAKDIVDEKIDYNKVKKYVQNVF